MLKLNVLIKKHGGFSSKEWLYEFQHRKYLIYLFIFTSWVKNISYRVRSYLMDLFPCISAHSENVELWRMIDHIGIFNNRSILESNAAYNTHITRIYFSKKHDTDSFSLVLSLPNQVTWTWLRKLISHLKINGKHRHPQCGLPYGL